MSLRLNKRIELVNKTIGHKRGIVGMFKTSNNTYEYKFIQSPNTTPKRPDDISLSDMRMARKSTKRQEINNTRTERNRSNRQNRMYSPQV